MVKHFNAYRCLASRLLLTVLALSVVVFTSGCGIFGTKRKIEVPLLLTPRSEASKNELIQAVNRLATVRSIHGKVDIRFEDTSFASVGVADQYRLVDGTLTLQRPGQIYLLIQFTFVDIAAMTSDGQHFRVAVLQGDEKYRRFVKGTNNANYKKLPPETTPAAQSNQAKSEKETVNALSNLRPQHLTDAFMIRPIEPNSTFTYSQSEFFQEESDVRPQAKKGSRVVRSYYLLEEFSQPNAGDARVMRRFWFDRVGGIRLARVQTYDDRGRLITDVSYFNEMTLGSRTTASLPSRVEITRPQDEYKLSISYQDSGSVELDKGYDSRVFILENKWGLTEVDLDAQNKKVTANQ